VVQAFGLEGFGTPAGYLRGGLYELVVPLLFAAAGIMFANTATAAEEDAGRLELFLAQPVSRTAFLVGRSLAVFGWLLVLAVVVLVSQLVSDAVFGLQIDASRVVATVVLCGLLGALHAGLCIAVAGAAARPGRLLSTGLGIAFAGYLVLALFPLSSVLAPWRHISPWDWALGGDPLVNAAAAWRYAALAVPAVLLAIVGVVAFDRRDVRALSASPRLTSASLRQPTGTPRTRWQDRACSRRETDAGSGEAASAPSVNPARSRRRWALSSGIGLTVAGRRRPLRIGAVVRP
jgi:ABC-2 type transport system permease protein